MRIDEAKCRVVELEANRYPTLISHFSCRQRGDNQAVGKPRERAPDGPNLPDHDCRDPLPNELHDRRVETDKKVPPDREPDPDRDPEPDRELEGLTSRTHKSLSRGANAYWSLAGFFFLAETGPKEHRSSVLPSRLCLSPQESSVLMIFVCV